MSLDVRLWRDCQVPWGFRLIGGTDVKLPLTVAKIQRDGCAEGCGLRVGDVLTAINGIHTSCMTHDEAQDAIVKSGDDIALSVDRGPFDGLEEMRFQTIEEPSPDIDQSLHPSEVPCDRSNTASPFLMPTKPYRPFSTEPVVEVPPLEEPIILNPNYHDEFPKIDNDELKVETVFKLPISPQYAPERYGKGDRRKKAVECADNTIKNITEVAKVEVVEDNAATKTEVSSLARVTVDFEDVKFMKQMNAELDIAMIEETASYVVDESVEKGVSVAEKITNKNEQSLADVTSKTETKNTSVSWQEESKATQETFECTYVNNISKNAVEIQSKDEVVSKSDMISITKNNEEIIIENNNQQTQEECVMKEDKVSTSQTISNIDDAAVVLDHSTNKLDQSRNERFEQKQNVSHMSHKETETLSKQKESAVSSQRDSVVITESVTDEKSDKSSSKYSTSRLLAEQRAYVLGLQTIPNIRGRAHSSYQYDLLLKTFFIHLTDVMVALSRFILTDKPLSKSSSTENITQKEETKTGLDVVKSESRIEETFSKEQRLEQNQTDVVSSETNVETSQVANGLVASMNNAEETIDHRKVSGSKMAQMSSKESNELIQKMDAVVTEFQKNVEFESGEVKLESSNLEAHDRTRRSRSRSRIEELVAKESDPLEWLSKLEDVKNTEHTTTKREAINTSEFASQQTVTLKESNIKTSEKSEKMHQIINNESISSEAKSSAGNTYIAIVESHVYTNKNAIINEANTLELHNMSSQSIEDKNDHIRQELSEKVITETVSNKQVEIEDKSVEISLEEAMAKSNIAIVTCEAITDTFQDTNAQESVVTLESKTTESNIIELNATNNESRECITVVNAILESSEAKSSENCFTQSTVLEESKNKIEVTSHEESKLKTHQQYNIEEAQVTVAKLEATTAVETSSETVKESSFTARLPNFTEISDVSSEIQAQNTEHTTVQTEVKVAESAITLVNLETQSNSTTHVEIKLESNHQHNLEEVEQLAAEYEAASIIENSLAQNTTTISQQSSEMIQESSSIAQTVTKMNESIDARPNTLSLNIGFHNTNEEGDETDIKTPTPSTVPPTPLTDEYVFRLAIPLVESSIPASQELIEAIPEAVEHEDLNIVKKKLIPHIETTIESIVYDKPLSTPTSPSTNITGPAFTQHGLETGKVDETKPKDEILEIERKSSLLASVIDETIKSIEEYKGQVEMNGQVDSSLNQQTELNKGGEERSNKEESTRVNTQDSRLFKEETNADTKTIEQKWRSVSAQMQFSTESLANVNQRDQFTNTNGFNEIEDTRNGVNTVQINGYNDTNEVIGTNKGIISAIDGDIVMDDEVAKELGKPGMTDVKIAEIMSGESEMLREAHVMGDMTENQRRT